MPIYARHAAASTNIGPQELCNVSEQHSRRMIWPLLLVGVSNGRLDSFTIEQLSVVLANKVLAAHPTGRWRLAACCRCTCLAAETARILQRRTGKVCGLILIDAFFTEYLPTPWVHFMRLVDFGPT